MEADGGKPTLIVSGNCQGSFLARALAECPRVAADYRVVYFRDFRKGDAGVLSEEDMRSCAFFVEQVAHNRSKLPDLSALPAGCLRVRYPILWMYSLWPTFVRDPRSTDPARPNAGDWPYGDRLILEFLDQGLTPEEASRRFLETDLRQVMDLDRFHEINAEKSRQIDEMADLKWGGPVFDAFQARRLFATNNHPVPEMLETMRQTVFEAIGAPAPPSDLVEASGGMGRIHWPIHPSVAEHFKLEWYDPDAEHQYFENRYRIGEFMRRYAAFE